MAVANGTCVSFCNQPKAHFGLPCVRPWNNRGKCHMDEKEDSMLVKLIAACIPICFQPFPNNSTRKVQKFAILAYFCTFWPPLARVVERLDNGHEIS